MKPNKNERHAQILPQDRRQAADALRQRRDEVLLFLSERPAVSHAEWQRRFALDIPLDFVRWFRNACSQYFEYDLSAALPDDRLVEDFEIYDATFSDVDMGILGDYEARCRIKIPDDGQTRITTFGQFLQTLWLHAQHTNAF